MLVDANILLYAVDETSPVHDRARSWLEDALNGMRRVARRRGCRSPPSSAS